MKLLFVDTEFFSPECLATGAMVVVKLNDNMLGYDLIDILTFNLKHDKYLIDPECVKVNNIDYMQHHSTAKERNEIEAEIRQFIKKHATILDCSWPADQPMDSDHMFNPDHHNNNCVRIEKLIPVGHAIRGDVDQIKTNFPNLKWSTYVKSNLIDTLDLARTCQVLGYLDKEMSISLSALTSAWGFSHVPHIALDDCLANIDVFIMLTELLKGE